MFQVWAFLQGEWAQFAKLPRNAKLMLGTSTIAGLAMPVTSIFVYAFIMRCTRDVNQVMAFQFALYAGIPLAFLINRFLVGGRRGFAHLYAAGIILCGTVFASLTLLDELSVSRIVVMGFLMGLSTGLHWANRNFLSLVCTQENNRNYYFGVESFFFCLSGVVMPGLVGAFIARWSGPEGTPAAARVAYQVVAGVVLLLVLGGASFLLKGSFPAERPAIVVRSKFKPVWRKLLFLAALKGTVHIFFMTAPVVLVMRVLGGQENALGIIQSAGAVFAAVLLYIVGRSTRPEHRVSVMAVALLLYCVGATANAALYDRASVLLFMACQIVAQPMLDLSYNPLLLSVLDSVSGDEGESRYAYIVSHELGIFSGRLVGAVTFIAIACSASGDSAFRYVLAVMSVVHLLCWPMAVAIQRDLGWRPRRCAHPFGIERSG